MAGRAKAGYSTVLYLTLADRSLMMAGRAKAGWLGEHRTTTSGLTACNINKISLIKCHIYTRRWSQRCPKTNPASQADKKMDFFA